MVNKALRIVLYSIFTISLLFVVPFNNINADTISASNIHLNTSLKSVNYDHTPYFYNYEYEFVFDKQYVGWVSVNVVSTYYSDNNFTQTQSTFQKAIYVNGGTASITNGFYSTGNYASGCLVSASFSVVNSNVIEYSVINSLEQVIDILQDIDDHISIDVLGELENIVANTSLSNQYLEAISKFRQYNIPYESVPINFYLMYVKKYEPVSFNTYYYWQFPFYHFSSRKQIIDTPSNSTASYDFVVMCDASLYSANVVTRYFEFVNLNFTYENIYRDSSLTIIKMTLTPIDRYAVGQVWSIAYNNKYLTFAPIYFNLSSNRSLSTDFALSFGLTNTLLDNIQLIANGTNDSSAASSQSDQANSQLQQDSNTLFTQEDTFKQNMNSAMHNIDTTFSLNNFGSSFMTSAQWVRTQYETLTNNTPFASLITFSLLVGLALIVIGKVYK